MKIYIDGKCREVDVCQGEKLLDVFKRCGIAIDAPCGGECICGGCKVVVSEGVGAASDGEAAFLSADEVDKGVRLACCTYAADGMSVSLASANAEIQTHGYMPSYVKAHMGYSVAVDIGTTTVVAYLLHNGEVISHVSGLNEQKAYGADVLSRIHFCDNEGGLQKLHDVINKQIEQMTAELCKGQGIERASIAQTVIVGNTTMLHLFAGVSPQSIGVAPFTPVFTKDYAVGDKVLLGSISGYVGSDIVAGILASELHKHDGYSLFIDIGTNGEIALGNSSGIVCAATAAGPAFEGAHIACGIGGVSGAINSIKCVDGEYVYTTIDDAEPIGIAGSAVIDIVAAMLENGTIDETGMLDDDVNISREIFVCPRDIREVQLAKAAIAAGIQTLLDHMQLTLSDIAHCYIAGGFGSHLNIGSAVRIGLLPEQLQGRVVTIGNSAGSGCIMWATSDDCKREYEHIKSLCEYVELSGSKFFNDAYIDNMLFP